MESHSFGKERVNKRVFSFFVVSCYLLCWREPISTSATPRESKSSMWPSSPGQGRGFTWVRESVLTNCWIRILVSMEIGKKKKRCVNGRFFLLGHTQVDSF